MELSVDACCARIGRLPHAGILDPAHVGRWIDLTKRIDPDRIDWHIARAGGVGGSEAGTLLEWRFPEDGIHSRSNAVRLARSKLLMLPPDRPNDDTARGAFLEDFIREKIFEEKVLAGSGCSWSRADDLKALIEGSPHPDYPWLRASLDGVYRIDGKVYIVDFKAPSSDMLDEYIAYRHFGDYRAQLNHYGLVAEGHGVHIDGMLLAMFDYRRVASAGCQVFPIAVDPDLQQKIIIASGEFWNLHVMRGSLPENDVVRVLRADAGVPADIEMRARSAVLRKAALDKLAKDYDEDQKAIAAWVRATGRLGNGMLPIGRMSQDPAAEGFFQIRGKEELDSERAVARLRDLGMDEAGIEALRDPPVLDAKKLPAAYLRMSDVLKRLAGGGAGGNLDGILAEAEEILGNPPLKETGEYNPERLTAALESFGEVSYNFMTEKISSGLPRARNSDKAELLARVHAGVDVFLSGLVPCDERDENLLTDHHPASGQDEVPVYGMS